MKSNSFIYAFTLLIALVLINVLSSFSSISLDVTENGIYTLSPNTHQLLKQLPSNKPLSITLYFSESHPEVPPLAKSFVKRISTLLGNYAKLNPQISFRCVDPIPDSEEEENARANNILAERLPNGDNIYLGLNIRSIDQKVTLPAISIDQEPLLEYQVTSSIMQLLEVKKPKIAILSSVAVLSETSDPSLDQSWAVFKELSKRYELIFPSLDPVKFKLDPNETGVLLLFYPINLPELVRYKIDQYILRGGRVALFMDAYGFSCSNNIMSVPDASSFQPFLSHWGIQFETSPIIDLATALRDKNTANVFIQMFKVINPKQISQKSPITASLKEFSFMAPGGFTLIKKEEGISYIPLISTSSEATAFPLDTLLDQRPINNQALASFKKHKQLLALQLSGYFSTSFPDGKPYVSEDYDSFVDYLNRIDSEHLSKAIKPAEVIMISDIDAFHNIAVLQEDGMPANDNFYLFQNMLDALSGHDKLLSIRIKPPSVRPLTKILTLRQKAADAHHQLLSQYEEELIGIAEQIEKIQRPGTQSDGRLIITPAMEQKIQTLETKRKTIQNELKKIRRDVRRDIDSLEFQLELINLLLMPLLLIFTGFGIYIFRKIRCRARR